MNLPPFFALITPCRQPTKGAQRVSDNRLSYQRTQQPIPLAIKRRTIKINVILLLFFIKSLRFYYCKLQGFVKIKCSFTKSESASDFVDET
jgi:hypothetical protein